MSGQRTQWNEATRVQMPALVHLTRIGFTYFGKITEDKAGTVYDPDTNILIEVFKSQFAKLNPERAGEAEAMVRLNRDDIRFDERECVVFGKGDKERIVYFDARTKIHLQNYLQSRTDSESALFVSLRSPHRRLTIGGIELRLRELGKRLDIPKVHPHKFRRTLATMAIDKGMPIEQLQHLLGHQRIDTTMHYAMVKQSNVKLAHKKYIG